MMEGFPPSRCVFSRSSSHMEPWISGGSYGPAPVRRTAPLGRETLTSRSAVWRHEGVGRGCSPGLGRRGEPHGSAAVTLVTHGDGMYTLGGAKGREASKLRELLLPVNERRACRASASRPSPSCSGGQTGLDTRQDISTVDPMQTCLLSWRVRRGWRCSKEKVGR